jgi:hypothetical protein
MDLAGRFLRNQPENRENLPFAAEGGLIWERQPADGSAKIQKVL